MKCYQHEDTESTGTCKHCCKAVCKLCAIDTGHGLACSERCEQEVQVLREIMNKSAQIYGVGSNSKVPPTGVLMYAMFGIMFLGWGTYNSISRDRLDLFALIMGTGFLAFGIYTYFRVRKLNLNC